MTTACIRSSSVIGQNAHRAYPFLARIVAGRIAGLKAASGTILAFPDDDCRYRPQTLARVIEFFDQHPAADGMTGRAFAARGERPSARFAKQTHWLSRRSVWMAPCAAPLQICTDARVNGAAPPLRRTWR